MTMLRLTTVMMFCVSLSIVANASPKTRPKDGGDPRVSDASPPEGALGFTFGWSKSDSEKACTDRHGEWTPGPVQAEWELYACQTRIGALNREASIALQFVHDRLAGITASYEVKPKDAVKEFRRVSERMMAVYGDPSDRVIRVPGDCKSQRLHDCLLEKTAEATASWIFRASDHAVNVSLDDGPERSVGVSLAYTTAEGRKAVGHPGL
jgi:hypothetical protein